MSQHLGPEIEWPGLGPINRNFQKKSENFKTTIFVRKARKII
jgi:hypothetical protein